MEVLISEFMVIALFTAIGFFSMRSDRKRRLLKESQKKSHAPI